MTAMVTLPDIEEAGRRIAGHVVRTPLLRSQALSRQSGAPIFLKLENHQKTGSFKLRGATNAILCLDEKARSRGLTTASTGNHGRAVAHAARTLGVRATICLSALFDTVLISSGTTGKGPTALNRNLLLHNTVTASLHPRTK